MKNYEKYIDEIVQDMSCSFKMLNLGSKTRCIDRCDFTCTECNEKMKAWLQEEYVPEVDWSKVKVDTPVLVSNNGNDWYEAHFASYKENEVYVWTNGKTSWSASDDVIKMRAWEQAKLAESEDE